MRLLVRLAIMLAAVIGGASAARADRLELIENRGQIIIGVKADYPPFGMVDSAGRLVGIEADLAADLARRLGVGMRLLAVTSGNRLQKLEEGSVDLIIATLGDTAQRRTIATLLEPGYFSSGANIMLRPSPRPVGEWQDLLGQKVCATLGALFNPVIGQRYLLDLQVFKDNRDVKLALRDGRCVGWLYDDIAILNELKSPEWLGYSMPLDSVVTTPWAIALAREERNGRLARQVADIVADWHRSGFLIETMQRWGMPVSSYLETMRTLWSARDEQGQYVCRMQPDGSWPTACRDESRLTVDDVAGMERLVLLIRERTGLNFSFLRSPFEQHQLEQGIRSTVILILGSILGSIAVGLAGAAVIARRVPVLSGLVASLATFLRMTPPLLLIYVVFFGVGYHLAVRTGLTLNALVVAAVCLSAYAGATNLSAFLEAWDVLARRDSSPSARAVFALAYAPVMGSCVNIAKATGMASAIAVPELVYASASIVAQEGNPDVMMNLLLVVYFLLILGVVATFEQVRRRIARDDRY